MSGIATDVVRVSPESLAGCAASLLEAAGLTAEDAALAADVLLSADLRGVDSHGVSNMLRRYLRWLGNGHAAARPELTVLHDAPSARTLDGGGGLGVVAAPAAMAMAIEKAADTGVGIVTVANSRHLGMAAYHAMLALPHDMIGVAMTAVGPRVAPTFGREARLGTNPIAVAAPARSGPPFVFDASTSVITSNRVRSAYRRGTPLQPGTVADWDGAPAAAPLEPPEDSEGVLLLPLGSTRELGSHKGYGLATVVEILCTVLSGSSLMIDLGLDHACHFLMAVNVAAFGDAGRFLDSVERLTQLLSATQPIAGQSRVLVAGTLEWEAEAERRRLGVPLDRDVIEWFELTCAEVGCEPPVIVGDRDASGGGR